MRRRRYDDRNVGALTKDENGNDPWAHIGLPADPVWTEFYRAEYAKGRYGRIAPLTAQEKAYAVKVDVRRERADAGERVR